MVRARVTNQLTCGEEDQIGDSIDDASGVAEDNRDITISKGRVNTPVLIGRIGLCNRTVQAKMSTAISFIIFLRRLTNR